MSARLRVILSAIPPSQTTVLSPGVQALRAAIRESELYSTLLAYLKPYVNRVLEGPKRANAIAEELLRDEKALILLLHAIQKAVLELKEEDVIEVFKFLHGRFGTANIDVEEALDVILEHEVWKLRQIKRNFDEYMMMFYTFSTNYPEEAYDYAVIYFSISLLLLASSEAKTYEELRALGEELDKLAEELEAYALTFMLMLEEKRGGTEVVATARTPRSSKRS
jgi:hypothetical protein